MCGGWIGKVRNGQPDGGDGERRGEIQEALHAPPCPFGRTAGTEAARVCPRHSRACSTIDAWARCAIGRRPSAPRPSDRGEAREYAQRPTGNVVFAGGRNRCPWRAGFWSVAESTLRSRAAAPGRRQRRGRVRVGDLRGRAEDTLARSSAQPAPTPQRPISATSSGGARVPALPHRSRDADLGRRDGEAWIAGKSAENDAVSGP